MNELLRALMLTLTATSATPSVGTPTVRLAESHNLVSDRIVTVVPSASAGDDVALPVILSAQRTALRSQSRDAWLGPDKFRHFWTSYAATAFAYAGVRAAGTSHDTALLSGLAAGVVAGIGKEVHDNKRGRIFSARDLVADALGLGAAYVLLRQVR